MDLVQVRWDESDGQNPKNWSHGYRAWCTLQLGLLAFAASLGSSIIAPSLNALSVDFHIGKEVAVFAISLYVLGFALGPLLWAGISETFGRRWSMLPAVFCLGIFSIGTAVSKNALSLFLTRFFGGVFGSAPVSNVSATLGDMYHPNARGVAISFYALAVVGGPTIGPVIGSALTLKLSWRWTEYIEAICTLAIFLITLFCLPETYEPVLLKKRAAQKRIETGDNRYWHPHEDVELDLHSIARKQLIRPLRMLATEPIVTVVAIYASFTYSLLYMTLEIFPIVFEEIRQMSMIVSTLPFLSLFVGILCALSINLGNTYFYRRAVNKAGGRAVPEARLPPILVGATFFAVGLFWFGWTATPRFHWIIPVTAIAFIGSGFNIVFQNCISFLIDCYALYGASAVSANTFLRSLLASGLPFAIRPMFRTLGVGWSMTVLGAVASVAIFMPLVFMRYGRQLRIKSKFAFVHDDEQ